MMKKFWVFLMEGGLLTLSSIGMFICDILTHSISPLWVSIEAAMLAVGVVSLWREYVAIRSVDED